jgi:SpoVK/Ycf46/Vps4 family AAA+-type ATPase
VYVHKHLKRDKVHYKNFLDEPKAQAVSQPRVHQLGANSYARKRLSRSWLSYSLEESLEDAGSSDLMISPKHDDLTEHYDDKLYDALNEDQDLLLVDFWTELYLKSIPEAMARRNLIFHLHSMMIRPARRLSIRLKLWKTFHLPWRGSSHVSWSERMYGKTTWQITPKLVHPWFLAFRLWAFLLQVHLITFVLVPMIRKLLYDYAVKREWIRNSVWNITYLDRKGENNRRTLKDIVALNPYLEQELLTLIHTLREKEGQPTKRVWAWSEFEKGHKFLWPWESVLFRYPLPYHAGVLLVGPPGTGKTLLGQALAGSANVRFLGMTSSEFLFKGIKAGPTNIHHLFVYARSNAPCVLFIDEIDTLTTVRTGRALQQNILPTTVGTYRDLRFSRWRPGLARRRKKAAGDFWRLNNPFWSPDPVTRQTYFEYAFNADVDHLHGVDIGERRAKAARWESKDASALTIQMLTEIDGCYKKSKVFLMGSTNRLARIDAAITRPGRIDRIIHLARPDSDQRLEMLKHYTQGQEILFPMRDFNWHQVHAMTVGMTAADISTLVNESKVYSVLQQIKLERKLGRLLGSSFPHAHTTISMERGVDVVTSILSSDLRQNASELTLNLYQPFLWSAMAYYRAARAIVINYLPPFSFVGATLFTQRPRGRKNFPLYDKVDGEAHFERFDASLCKAAVLAHLSGIASKFLLMQRRSIDTTGLAWLDLHHSWELELATAYAYKIVDQWALFDPYVSVSRVMLGSKTNVNMGMEKRAYRVRKFKLFVPRLQKASRLGRKFKLLESTVFQQNYSFEIEPGEEAYIADMPIWWDSYFLAGSSKREDNNMQNRFLVMWKRGTRRRYTNREWITPFRYQSGYRLRTWNQQSLYLDPRDSQMTNVMQNGLEVVWKLLEDHRALLDQCVIIMLIKRKLRAKDLAKFMVPFKVVRQSYFEHRMINPDLDLEPLRRPSQYVPRRLERSWRFESNRFIGDRQQRILTPKRTPVWIPPTSQVVISRSANFETLLTHLDQMTSHLQSMNHDLNSLVQLVPGITGLDEADAMTKSIPVLDQNSLQVLEARLGMTLGLPEPSRCRRTTTSASFLNEVLSPLDPWITPAKQLEHLAVQVAYSMALVPITERVQDWILRWSRQEMHVFDLFWMLIPLDSNWKLTSDQEHLKGMTVHQVLSMEPERYSWFLMSNPDNILWGQDVPNERIQAWAQFCQTLQVNMDKRLAERDLTIGSDFFNDLVQKEFPSITFERLEGMTEEVAIRILDLADGWLRATFRHQSIVHALSENAESLNLQEASKLRNILQHIAEREKEFVENIPTLRTQMCHHTRDAVHKYAGSVALGRKICSYAANRFYYLQDMRQLSLEND